VKAPQHDFVGVGIVAGPPEPAKSFRVRTPEGTEMPILDVAKSGHYHRDHVDDPERCDYFVPVERAVREIGLFGNQNTICRPTTPK
jgi:hypothetical protein